MKNRLKLPLIRTAHRQTWLFAMLIAPLLGGCGTGDLSPVRSDGGKMNATVSISESQMPSTQSNPAACELLFEKTPIKQAETPSTNSDHIKLVTLRSTPEENLFQAVSYELDGDYVAARRLYVWLTASSLESKIDLDCGQGFRLSGSINSFAQRRLKALDSSQPHLATSEEIENTVADATVPQGPALPNPPQIERDRDFYQKSGVVFSKPEDASPPASGMGVEMSELTARLTAVENRKPHPNPANSLPGSAPRAAPAIETSGASASRATIGGEQFAPDIADTKLASTSRPAEEGALEVSPRKPEPATEKPMASQQPGNRSKTSRAHTPQPNVEPHAPYYTVQLAAYRTRERAESAWRSFQSQYGDLLNATSHEVTTIALEGRGLFFRLMTGQYDRKTDAQKVCASLQSRGLDCLIRHVTP